MPLFYNFIYRSLKALLPLLAFLSYNCFAQQDSLQTLVQANGSEKITRLEKWCNRNLFFYEPQTRQQQLLQLEQLAVKKNDKITLAAVVFYRGLYSTAMDQQQPKAGIAQMQKAIAMADKNGQPLQAAYFKHSLGYYYFTEIKEPVEALQNLLQAHYHFNEIGYENLYNSAGMLDRLGFVYYHLSNFNQAIKYFKLSLKNPMENPRRHIGILNSIGLSYREVVEMDSAKKYFKQSRHQALLAKDTAWIGINSGDIAKQYLSEKTYDRALPFMQEYYNCSVTARDTELIIEALTGLADISLHSGKVNLALQQLEEAEELLQQAFKSEDIPVQNYVRKQYLFNILSKAWDANGNTARSLDYLKAANTIKDSIERRARLSKNNSIQQLFEAEQTNSRLQLLKEEKEAAELMQKLYISLGALLAIVIALLYSRQIRERKIQKQKEALLQLEKEITETELKSSREQLQEYVLNLRRKADLLEETRNEMHLLRQQHQIPVENEQAVLHKLRFSTILTEEDWTKFKMLFEKAHPGFFLKLKETYAGLTPAETRLCSLFKLGFNSHEMASMMGISIMSIKKNRQRLRKKIDLSKEQKLEDLFQKF